MELKAAFKVISRMSANTKPKKESSMSLDILDNIRTAIVIVNKNYEYLYSNVAADDILGSAKSIKKIDQLSCDDISLKSYIDSVIVNDQSIMLRDLKFKNFERIDRICDCNISSCVLDMETCILIEFNETGRLYNISNDQNLIDQQKATQEMVKGLSHEIKNPLGGIMGAAQLLDRSINNSEQAKFTSIILKESDRLLKLINAMSSPKPSKQKEKVNIHEITEHVIELFKYDKLNESVEFIKDYDPSIPLFILDRNQIIQALINILKNAVQATNNKGKIAIKTRAILKFTIGQKKYDLVAKVDVIDNGKGIPEDKLKEIFYPMVTSKPDGMGLGLTIAQSLVTQNNGIIECVSRKNHTVFSVIIPWSAENEF